MIKYTIMVEQKKLMIFTVFLFVFVLLPGSQLLPAQFDADPFGTSSGPGGGSTEPVIKAEARYDQGLVLFMFSVDPNYHITDVKNGFFKIETTSTDVIEIIETVFPEGVAYAEEKVFKGNFEVKVYVKNRNPIEQPVTVKFKVSYQVCKEHPIEMCFAPADQVLEIDLTRSFVKATIDRATQAVPQTRQQPGSEHQKGQKNMPIHPWLLLVAGVLLLAIAIFAGLFKPAEDADIKVKFFKVFLVLVFLAGALLYIKALDTGMNNSTDAMKVKPEHPVKLDWIHNLEEAKKRAREEKKNVMIDTSAEWCVACRELEEYTFSHPEVHEALKNYLPVKLDFTENNETNKKLGEQLKIFGMPTVIFLDSEGKELRRFSGFYNKHQFLEFLGSGSSFFEKLLKPLNRELEKRSILLFLLVFGLGFLTSLTPCVYPVIPIVMGYIGTRSGKKKLKGFYLSIFFVLGLTLVYSILGVIAGTTGTMMGASFQNPIVVIIIAAIFVFMGLSLAGLFEIPVPTSISSKMQSGHKSEVIGSLLVGGVSGVIAAPCVGPVLIALLSWISQTRDIVFGFFLTFTFSLGMGVIFLAVGTFSGILSALPKGGKWMDIIKYFFAAILIAGGIFILNPIIATWISTLLWGIFLVSLAVFMGLLNPLSKANIKSKIYKLIVVSIFLAGVLFFMKSIDNHYFSVSQPETAVVETGWLSK